MLKLTFRWFLLLATLGSTACLVPTQPPALVCTARAHLVNDVCVTNAVK